MIIIITIFSVILYYIGFGKTLLDAFKIKPATRKPARKKRTHKPLQAQQEKQPAPPELSERELLELQARPVIAAMGQNPDTVTYMSEHLLRALINDYIKENK